MDNMARPATQLEVCKTDILGKGAYGYVFKGWLSGVQVAVKRIQLPDLPESCRESRALDRLYHPNVIKLLHIEDDDNFRYTICIKLIECIIQVTQNHTFRYIVTELCAGSLDQCFQTDKYKGPHLPADRDCLRHLASGLEYIHTMQLVHRDIKPENVLVALRPVRLVWSDFGTCKPISSVSGSFSMSGIRGTNCWIAPELLVMEPDLGGDSDEPLARGTVQSDVFSAGCVFFYIVTKGFHPFGVKNVEANIQSGDPVYLKTSLLDHNSSDIY